jgi:hypothetical protein
VLRLGDGADGLELDVGVAGAQEGEEGVEVLGLDRPGPVAAGDAALLARRGQVVPALALAAVADEVFGLSYSGWCNRRCNLRPELS